MGSDFREAGLYLRNPQKEAGQRIAYPKKDEQENDYVFESSDNFSIYFAQNYNNIATDFVISRKNN